MKNQLTITTHPVVVAFAVTLLFIECVIHLHAHVLCLDILLVFSLALAAYSFPSFNTGSVNHKTISRFFFVVAVTSALVAILLVGMIPRLLVLSSCFVLFLLYRFGHTFWFSFRGNPMIKGPLIALCWTMIIVFFPINIYKNTIGISELFSLMMLSFCMVLVMAWLCDLVDLKNDTENRLQTIAVQLGPKRTISLVLLVMMVCTITLTFINPLTGFLLKSVVLADVLIGIAILVVTKLPANSAKWTVDALLLCKPLVMICMIA